MASRGEPLAVTYYTIHYVNKARRGNVPRYGTICGEVPIGGGSYATAGVPREFGPPYGIDAQTVGIIADGSAMLCRRRTVSS